MATPFGTKGAVEVSESEPSGLPPVWLLDVDGVINAMSKRGDRTAWPADQWAKRDVLAMDGLFPVLTADPVLDFLRTVHETGAAEIRWHTSWQQWAVAALAPALGLPSWPVAEAPEFTDAESGFGTGHAWWKLGAAERVVHEEGRRLVWTDDDLRWETRSNPSLPGLLARPGVLGVATRPHTGLLPRDLRSIAEFVRIDWPRPADTSVTAVGSPYP